MVTNMRSIIVQIVAFFVPLHNAFVINYSFYSTTPSFHHHVHDVLSNSRAGHGCGHVGVIKNSRFQWSRRHHDNDDDTDSTSTSSVDIDIDKALSKIMHISSGHFKSQALHAFVKLKIPNIMQDKAMTIHEIAVELDTKTKTNSSRSSSSSSSSSNNRSINEDALLRTMKLLTTLDVVNEEYNISSIESPNLNKEMPMTEVENLTFQLTSFGKLLQNNNVDTKQTTATTTATKSVSSCILHWMENPLSNSWHHLPNYILGTSSNIDDDDDNDNDSDNDNDNDSDNNDDNPFIQANGISSDYFYNINDNPQSLAYANEFVKLISESEINSIVKTYDWSKLDGKTIIDIGGYDGRVMKAILSHYSNNETNFKLKCLDLPHVISSVIDRDNGSGNGNGNGTNSGGVELIKGDIMNASTIPKCDVIFMKHFLDRCMWTEKETVQILQTCSNVIPDEDGLIILGEAAIPSAAAASSSSSLSSLNEKKINNNVGDDDGELPLSLDALYMLVGRERQRTVFEWECLAERANLKLNEIIPTASPSCYILILGKKSKETW